MLLAPVYLSVTLTICHSESAHDEKFELLIIERRSAMHRARIERVIPASRLPIDKTFRGASRVHRGKRAASRQTRAVAHASVRLGMHREILLVRPTRRR